MHQDPLSIFKRRAIALPVVTSLLLALSPLAYAEEFVGDITRYSPEVGQPLFPVGNINIFKQFAFGFDESLKVGKKVDLGLATFGAEATGTAAAHMGFEFGLCLGGNADYDLGFKPRISVPDKIPYEFPLTLHVEEGLMADSKFTTNFPPLGKAYADLIFDVTLEAKFEACVFGCLTFTLFSLQTANLGGMVYNSIPIGYLVPSEIAGIFNKSVRCDPTVSEKAYTGIELASWNRLEDNKFKMLNVVGSGDLKKPNGKPDRLRNFLANPVLEFGGPIESGGGSTFTVNVTEDTLTTGGTTFASAAPVSLIGNSLPGGLAEKKVYYVVGSGSTFQLARRKGGSPLDITTSGGGTIRKGDAAKPEDVPKGGFDSWGKISITAPTVSTDSSVSEVDDRKRNFSVLPGNTIVMIPKVDAETGLQGFHEGVKVRVNKAAPNELPDGLNASCVYYVVNADTSGLQYQLATKIGGAPVEIAATALTNEIFRSAEFSSDDGLSSTGAEDIAAVTIDVVGLVNDVAFSASPLKVQANYDLGVASIDYKLLSLEVGPTIQLQTDFKMSWDLVVDDILFRQGGTMSPALVRFPELIDRSVPPPGPPTDFSSLKAAFPGRLFHLTSKGPNALPEISLKNGDPVDVTVMYHLEPKLKTKVSAPLLGRVKYEAIEVGAEIKKVGGIRLGPIVEGEHKFKLGEFTFYDGDPFALDKGKSASEGVVPAPRSDFALSEDLDRYDLVLVDSTAPANEPEPTTGCAEVVIIKKADGLHLKVFDVEGELIEKRSGPVSERLPTTGAELTALLTPWPTPSSEEKTAILKKATTEASSVPGVMSFKLQADGPADYHWRPFTSYDANTEADFSAGSTNPNTVGVPADYTYNDDVVAGSTVGYSASGPKGDWQYGYIQPTNPDAQEAVYTPSAFTPFSAASWITPGASLPNGGPISHYDANYFREEGVFMDPLVAAPNPVPGTERWPVRRWISPGGRVDVKWGMALHPGLGPLAGNSSNGVTGALYVNGVRQESVTTDTVLTRTPAADELSFELEFSSVETQFTGGLPPNTNVPIVTLRNTGNVVIRSFSLTIGDTNRNFDAVVFDPANDNNSDFLLLAPDTNTDGGDRTDQISIVFNSLLPGRSVRFQIDPDGGNEDYRQGLFNNGNAPNAVASVNGSNGATSSLTLTDSPMLDGYRYRSNALASSTIVNWDSFGQTITLDLKEGDILDLVLTPRGTNGTRDSWQDDAIMYMDVNVREHEWASVPNAPTNWAEFLSGNGAHQPNAYPGSVFTTGVATNWATIDKIDTAPFPSLTTSETIGTLNVLEMASLNFAPQTGQDATLTIHDGAIANSGTIDVFESAGSGNASMILGGPVVSDTTLTGQGTVKLRASSISGWKDPITDAAPASLSFVNYNRIEGDGSAMDLFFTHPATQSSVTNMGSMNAQMDALYTSARNYLNQGGLIAESGGLLWVEGNQFENRFGGVARATGPTSIIEFRFDEAINSGQIQADDGGQVTLLPGASTYNVWNAGSEESSAGLGTFVADHGTLVLNGFNAAGGGFAARNGGEMRTESTNAYFTGSNIGIGDFNPSTVDPSSGHFNLMAGFNRFTGVALRNYGQMTVNSNTATDFIDSQLFENHGSIIVAPTGSLRFREIRDRTTDENAAEIARRSPGLANATVETLLGGTWDIAGELLIDGASIRKIGADVQSDTSSGVTLGTGNTQIVTANTPSAENCALSLCHPAQVILRGTGVSFPALDSLSINCGTLQLLDGAAIPRVYSPQITDGDFSTYALSLVTVATTGELATAGNALVLVALVGTDLHIRIFDASGNTIVDRAESELFRGDDRTWLKALLNAAPFPDVATFSQEALLDIIRKAASISGYADFINQGNIHVSGTSSLKIGGGFYQTAAGATTSIDGTGIVSSATGVYEVSGGSVSVGSAAQFMNLNGARNGFMPGTSIVVRSPFVRGDVTVGSSNSIEIQPAAVDFAGSVITQIDAGASLTLHGSEVRFGWPSAEFPDSMIQSNAGELIISGDHGIDNRGRMTVNAFTNTGRVHILGETSELFGNSSYTQMGTNALTRVGPGAKLKLVGNLTVSGGELMVDIDARPHHPRFNGEIIVGGGQANLGNNLVINFGGDFLTDLRPDVGDTWEILSRKQSATVTGFVDGLGQPTVTFLVDGNPMPADWLPVGTHLEAVQLPTTFSSPRGLAIRVAPDAGWIRYDDWVTSFLGGPITGDYSAYTTEYFFGSTSGSPSTDPGEFQQSLVELDGAEFYQLTYNRRSGVDATFATYSSVDMKVWNPAPMAVLGVMSLGDGQERVTLRSTFELPDHRLFLQVRGQLNLDDAPRGLIPEKPIFHVRQANNLRNLESNLQNNVFGGDPPPYTVAPGRVLYFEATGDQNQRNNMIGGTTLGDLRLMSVTGTGDLESEGESMVIVALVGANLHIRIFDSEGTMVVDKAETALISGPDLTDLKALLNENPFPDESGFTDERRQDVIAKAASISGYVSRFTVLANADRDFIYQDKSSLAGAVMHAGLLNHRETGLVKVTFIERQETFIGSIQKSPDGRTTCGSKTKQDPAPDNADEKYSYRLEAYVDPS